MMPELAEKKLCCGCAACYNSCPKNAIEMKADETGFLYPKINQEQCVDCRVCESACPALKLIIPRDCEPHAYVGRHRDERIRAESTSGGIFTAIAESVLEKNGVVFGAAMDDGFVVKHKSVQSKAGLFAFRNSKYVQSEIGSTYRECKSFLEEGKIVCFSGTPCQIHGLIKYLRKQYFNLITVDIVCHSVPSPLIFKKYMELQKKKYPSINRVVFRDKAWGYSYSTMALYDNQKCLYRKGSEADLWFRSFLPGLCDRENCYDCRYQKWPRVSDITIWDCFVIDRIEKEFDDNRGATSIMTWSDNGQSLIQEIQDRADIREVNASIFTGKIEREMDKKITVDRKALYLDAQQMDPEEFFNKYRPTTGKVRAKIIGKTVLRKLGLINIVKRVIK